MVLFSSCKSVTCVVQPGCNPPDCRVTQRVTDCDVALVMFTRVTVSGMLTVAPGIVGRLANEGELKLIAADSATRNETTIDF